MAATSYQLRSGGRNRAGAPNFRLNDGRVSESAFSDCRAASPTRINLLRSSTPAVSSPVLFSVSSPSHRQAVKKPIAGAGKRACLCSPTTHPGSFRCSLHKEKGFNAGGSPATASRLNDRRSTMSNSLVRIGAVEGEWVRRALAALIRPSSHQQRRRLDFRPRRSRLSVMSMAGVCDDDR